MFLRRIIQVATAAKSRQMAVPLLQRHRLLLRETSVLSKNYSKYIEDDDDEEDFPRHRQVKDYSRSSFKGNFSQRDRFQQGFQRRDSGFGRSYGRNDNFAINLKPLKWDDIELVEFKKDFYEPHPNTMNRSKEEIEEFRHKHGITASRDVPNPILSIDELTMPDYALTGFKKQNFTELTPIQAQGWPIVLSGKNLVGVAQTGSGKTLGYILPALIHIKNQPPVQGYDSPIALVVAPTRELAIQIQTVAEEFGAPGNIRSICLYGGESKVLQANKLRNEYELIIATPGRLIDFLHTGVLNLKRCTYLVLDEADRMLDMGFEPQIRQIIGQIRPDRQTLMWSATWPREVRNLAEDFLSEYSQLNVGSEELCANHNITQIIKICNEANKPDHLKEILDEIWSKPKEEHKTIIFTQRKFTADHIARFCQKRGIRSDSIHSDKSQAQRQRILDNFRDGRTDILVATDVAARGLDVNGIKYVINYDYPDNSADYIHRIGRTGRSNTKGTAYTLFTEDNVAQAPDLIQVMKEAKQEVDPDLIKMSRYRRYRR